VIDTESFTQIEMISADALRGWLDANHGQNDSVWLVTWKKHVPDKYVSVSEILDALLCFGWIDGIRRKVDADRTMQLISPRQTQIWAKSYKERAARLQDAGLIHEAGYAAIAASKKRGLWNAMDDVDALVIPDDLKNALENDPPSFSNFIAFAPSYRRNVLRWLKLAKTRPTREKRIATILETSAQNIKIPQM
jgi:uncharacterized protein YdeI (YjbR/CyaY-like superfamily)